MSARSRALVVIVVGLAMADAMRVPWRGSAPERSRLGLARRARPLLLADELRSFSGLAREFNEDHASEVVAIALQHTRDVDFTRQELAGVKIASITEEGLELEEILCDVADDTCVAVCVPIVFSHRCMSEEELRAELAEMARLREDAPPPARVTAETSTSGLLETLNSQFGHTLELYVLRQGGVVLSEEDVLERCRAIDLDATGFTLESIVCHDEGESCEVVEKRVLFNRSCSSIDEIEDALCRLLLVTDSSADSEEQAAPVQSAAATTVEAALEPMG
jgi:hypothetical protein